MRRDAAAGGLRGAAWGLNDVARPANEGAAEIYRLLGRDDLAQVLSGESPLAPAAGPDSTEARASRLEAGLEAARSVIEPGGA